MKIRSSPLITLLFSALRACQRWESQDIFTLCKTQLLFLEEAPLQELENYCYTYGVTGKKWLSPFTGNPDGLQEGEMTLEQLQRLERLNPHQTGPDSAFGSAEGEDKRL